jgi:hypothetical protein
MAGKNGKEHVSHSTLTAGAFYGHLQWTFWGVIMGICSGPFEGSSMDKAGCCNIHCGIHGPVIVELLIYKWQYHTKFVWWNTCKIFQRLILFIIQIEIVIKVYLFTWQFFRYDLSCHALLYNDTLVENNMIIGHTIDLIQIIIKY